MNAKPLCHCAPAPQYLTDPVQMGLSCKQLCEYFTNKVITTVNSNQLGTLTFKRMFNVVHAYTLTSASVDKVSYKLS